MIALGAKVINTSRMTPDESSAIILKDIHGRLSERAQR
jgi:hypothetical protein